MRNSNAKLYNFMLILLLFVYLKHHYFVQLNHLYLTVQILFALKTSFSFQILANKESRPICFNIWLTEFYFILTKCLCHFNIPRKT